MAPLAQDGVILGQLGEVPAGQEIPDAYLDHLGNTVATDYDRLAELGVISASDAEDANTARAAAARAAADEAAAPGLELAALIADAKDAAKDAREAAKDAREAAKDARDALDALTAPTPATKPKPAAKPAASA